MARRREATPPQPARESTFGSTFVLAAIASLLLWASFPPLNLSWLAWLVPALWVYLIESDQLQKRKPYWMIWAISALTWGLILEGVGRAFWANYFGLVLLGSYLAFYQVLFVWLTRRAVAQWRLPVVIVAPVVWTGLELARAHLFTGFGVAMLSHTQYRATWLIQIADLFGAYGVSFVMVFVAACVAHSIRQQTRSAAESDTRTQHLRRWSPLAAASVALLSVYGYGATRTQESPGDRSTIKMALVQGTEDSVLSGTFEEAMQRSRHTFHQYWRLTLDVCEEHGDLALIVWPESVFSGGLPEVLSTTDSRPNPRSELTQAEFDDRIKQHQAAFHDKTRHVADAINGARAHGPGLGDTYLLGGTDTIKYIGDRDLTYNAALLVSPAGEVVSRYYKMHRVMVGEFVPLGDRLPWLYSLLPIGRGLTPGDAPASFSVDGVRMSPSICFESTVPHLIRRQFVELDRAGETPEVLVNLTNDGWFWGSGILDLQLACAVFRAVELRRPMVIAANTGLTAWVDSNGAIRQKLPRRQEGFLIAEVQPSRRSSVYQRIGDAAAAICLLICLAIGFEALWDRWRTRRARSWPPAVTGITRPSATER